VTVKNICNATKDFFQINAVLLNLLFNFLWISLKKNSHHYSS